MGSFYCTGKITLTNGSAAIVGVGTAWKTALVTGGTIFVEASGNVLPIAAVVSDTEITSEQVWKGQSGTYAYALQRDSAYLKTLDVNSRKIAELLANLDGDVARLDSPIFTGNPAAPTPAEGDSSTRLSTTAFVTRALSPLTAAFAPLNAGLAALTTALAGKQDIADRGLPSGFRNKIINGDFTEWQRLAALGFNYSGWVAPLLGRFADRWLTQSSGTGGNGSLSRQAFSPGQTDVPGEPEFFLRWQITTAPSGQASGSCFIEQRIEGVRTLAGQKATITLYVKGAGVLPSINLIQQFGVGGAQPVPLLLASNVALSPRWTKLQYVVNVPAITGKAVGSSSYLALNINVPINATYTLDLAHVSVVPGDASAEVDPCPPLHPQQVQALCRRYCFVGTADHAYGGPGGTYQSAYLQSLPVAMRVLPSITLGTPWNNYNVLTYVLTALNESQLMSQLTVGGSNNARYSASFTADAEL